MVPTSRSMTMATLRGVSDSWQSLEQLHAGGKLDLLTDPIFEGSDALVEGVKQFNFLLQAASGLRWQLGDCLGEPSLSLH
jgi:hypothetical protein